MRAGLRAWRAGGREGFALPLLLVLLLALTLLGVGTLLLARRELMASKAYLHAARSSLAARGALARGILAPPDLSGPRARDSVVSLGFAWIGDGLGLGGSLRWLGSELIFLQGEGRSRGWPGTRTQGAVAWSLDPVTRVASFGAGVEVDGDFRVSPGATVSSEDPGAIPEGWSPEECLGFGRVIDSIFSGTPLPLTGTPSPSDWPLWGSGSDLPALGLLSGEEILERAGESGASSPPTFGTSSTSGCPGSGDPILSGHRGDLDMSGGAFCGLLAVEGDLTVHGDALVQGLILVGGNLELRGAGRVEGLARVSGSLWVDESGIFRILGCPALRALSGIPALRKPILLPGGSGFPVH